MKRQNWLINLGIIGLLWFSLAFACNNGDDSGGTTNGGYKTDDSTTQSRGAIPNLAGTKWTLTSITNKSDAKRIDVSNHNLYFHPNGEWFLNAYPEGFDSGTYEISGNSLTMHKRDGTTLITYILQWDANANVLEMDSGKEIWSLTYQGADN